MPTIIPDRHISRASAFIWSAGIAVLCVISWALLYVELSRDPVDETARIKMCTAKPGKPPCT